jgi:hypothetical protein
VRGIGNPLRIWLPGNAKRSLAAEARALLTTVLVMADPADLIADPADGVPRITVWSDYI